MPESMHSLPTSATRTIVPFVVGLLASWGVTDQLGWADEDATGVVTLVVGAAWYLLVQALESRLPAAGWALGIPGRPAYVRRGRHAAPEREVNGEHERGGVRVAAALAFAAALLAVAVLPAAAAPVQRMPPPWVAARSVMVPEITRGAVGCTTHRTWLRVHVLAPERPGSQVWVARESATGVSLEGWFRGAWHPAVASAANGPGGLLTDAGWGRWRPVLATSTGRVIGPEWFGNFDLCSPFVDELVPIETGATS